MISISQARIAVFMGGRSSEHEISLKSGTKVLDALRDRRPLKVLLTRSGPWEVGGERPLTLGAAIDLVTAQADVAFLALHGENGEDGTIQGLLDTVGLPYTGSGVLGSALAMDKVRAKLVYRAQQLPTADFEAISRTRWKRARDDLSGAGLARLGTPCVIKPACAGSSVGVSFPKDGVAFAAAIDALFEKATIDLVIAERFIRGREFTCGVVSIDREERCFALPVTEIIPDARFEFFDYEAKYTLGASREITPAPIGAPLAAQIQSLALEAHLALGCRDFSRTDVRIDEAEHPFLLETNTIPGMTATSLLPQAAAVVGYSFEQLVDIALENALLRKR
jgi:D-alanine-D-alanine ligase